MKNPLAIILLFTGLIAAPAWGETLRGQQIHVSGDMVTLGDLFDGLADHADAQVAAAPPPGKTNLIDSGTLYQIAVSNGLTWRPAGLNQKVIVLRDGNALGGSVAATGFDLDTVLSPLKPALSARGAGDRLSVLLDGGEQQRLLAGISATQSLAVDQLQFDAATRKFTGTLTDAVSGKRYAVAGHAYALVAVPVPAHRISEGDVIAAADLTTLDQRQDALRSDTAQSASSLIGKVAKRNLDINQPVQERFVGMPIVVRRGDRVTMIVTNDGITLTAEGRALSDAGMGETVHLSNAASSKTVDGIVTGPNTAEIRTGTAMLSVSKPTTTTPTTTTPTTTTATAAR